MPYGDPKFTVVNPSPDVDATIRSFRASDYLSAAAMSAGSWSWGYVFGKPTRMACASTGLAIGMTAASMLMLQRGRARLRGYRENAREVQMYGAWPHQPDLKPMGPARFPIATGSASKATRPPLDWKNYD